MQPSNKSDPAIDKLQAELFSLDPNDLANHNRIKILGCKIAGHALYNELQLKGLNLTGVGVGGNSEHKIQIYLLNDTNIKLIPKTYNGYKVDVCITGKISAY